jgi:hypothetical protein
MTTQKPMVRIHDLQTNEVIDREMTDAEFAQFETEQAENAVKEAAAAAKATARAAILDRLGLTAEEAVLLLS